MRIPSLILAVSFAAIQLTSCASTGRTPTQVAANLIQRQSIVPTTTERYPAKNPQNVTFYTPEKTPHTAYRVIGVATIAKHNLFGRPREDDTMEVMMKKLAASFGGDGIINATSNQDEMQAHIIAFQKILI